MTLVQATATSVRVFLGKQLLHQCKSLYQVDMLESTAVQQVIEDTIRNYTKTNVPT